MAGFFGVGLVLLVVSIPLFQFDSPKCASNQREGKPSLYVLSGVCVCWLIVEVKRLSSSRFWGMTAHPPTNPFQNENVPFEFSSNTRPVALPPSLAFQLPLAVSTIIWNSLFLCSACFISAFSSPPSQCMALSAEGKTASDLLYPSPVPLIQGIQLHKWGRVWVIN